MAIQIASVALAAASTGTFTFTKPTANYGKSAGVNITDGGSPVALAFGADVDNGDGTMTGTVNLGAAVTGSVDIVIWDKP